MTVGSIMVVKNPVNGWKVGDVLRVKYSTQETNGVVQHYSDGTAITNHETRHGWIRTEHLSVFTPPSAIKTKSEIVITSNSAKGENIFHCWGGLGLQNLYVFTQRGKRGIDRAFREIQKEFPGIHLSITHSVEKNKIFRYFN